MCGCGGETVTAKYTTKKLGTVKGRLRRFIDGHQEHNKDATPRLWAKVAKSDGCWLWTASKNSKGYGQFKYKGKMTGSHRVAWILTNGEIPEGLCVLHKCDTPACCNPRHLFLGTQCDNMQDMYDKKRKNNEGVRNGRSKLTENMVLAIRQDPRPRNIVGLEYGMSPNQISAIVLKRCWTHV